LAGTSKALEPTPGRTFWSFFRGLPSKVLKHVNLTNPPFEESLVKFLGGEREGGRKRERERERVHRSGLIVNEPQSLLGQKPRFHSHQKGKKNFALSCLVEWDTWFTSFSENSSSSILSNKINLVHKLFTSSPRFFLLEKFLL